MTSFHSRPQLLIGRADRCGGQERTQRKRNQGSTGTAPFTWRVPPTRSQFSQLQQGCFHKKLIVFLPSPSILCHLENPDFTVFKQSCPFLFLFDPNATPLVFLEKDQTHQSWIQSSGCGCKMASAQANHMTAQRRVGRTARASSSPNHCVQMANMMRGQNLSALLPEEALHFGESLLGLITHTWLLPSSQSRMGSSLRSLCMYPQPLRLHTQSFAEALFCPALPGSCIQQCSALQQTHQNKAPAGAKSLHGFGSALIAHWLEQAQF